MRSWVDLAFSYALAGIFVLVGLRAIAEWARTKAQPQAHLAIATGLFGLNQLLSSINQTINNPDTLAEACTQPRALALVGGVLLYLSLYAFLYFLADFLTYPGWARAGAIAATVIGIALSLFAPVARMFDPDTKKIAVCPGATEGELALYNTYLAFAVVWLVLVFGILTVSFFRYAAKVTGLARMRMRTLAGGFGVLLVAVILIPALFAIEGTAATIILRLIQVLALFSAPLLYIGFTPPAAIARRYSE